MIVIVTHFFSITGQEKSQINGNSSGFVRLRGPG